MKNGGWTVFQRRRDGSENFYRGWADYVAGFGNLKREFWLGLDHIHCLTSAAPRTELRVYLADFLWELQTCSLVLINGPSTNYILDVGYHNWTSTVCDQLTYHNGMTFTTKDRDNDQRSGGNCASSSSRGGWWYKNCYHSALNGRYRYGTSWGSIYWHALAHGKQNAMKFTEMKLRPCD